MKIPYIIDKDRHESIDGANADVYLLGGLGIKVPKRFPANPIFDIKIEYFIHNKIYSGGYPTPKPYGIYPVKMFSESIGEERVTNALFMEKIQGKDLDQIVSDGEIYKIGKTCDILMQEALGIAKEIRNELGIAPRNSYGIRFRNLMYDYEKKSVVLIDFGDWEMKDGAMDYWIGRFFCGVSKDFRKRLFSEY